MWVWAAVCEGKKCASDDKYEKAEWNIRTQMIENEWIQVDGVSLVHRDHQCLSASTQMSPTRRHEDDEKIRLGNNDETLKKFHVVTLKCCQEENFSRRQRMFSTSA